FAINIARLGNDECLESVLRDALGSAKLEAFDDLPVGIGDRLPDGRRRLHLRALLLRCRRLRRWGLGRRGLSLRLYRDGLERVCGPLWLLLLWLLLGRGCRGRLLLACGRLGRGLLLLGINWGNPGGAETGRSDGQADAPEEFHECIPFHSA